VDLEAELDGPRRDFAIVLGAKALIGATVLATGFRAVSDDDYARVVLAQSFAHAPRLDPTGTSWLPFPFWLTGGAMRLVGDTSLGCARVVAFAVGLASSALILLAARLLVVERRAVLVGALAASLFPWSARLGVATVPELPTAALALFAVATLAASSGKLRVVGGAALLAASLSRYEPWSLAGAFVFMQLFPGRLSAPTSLRARLVSAVLALAGPLAWILHNALAHGEALHFLARVSAYKRALGGEDPLAALAYPLALVREEPELWLLGGLTWIMLPRAEFAARWRGPVVSLVAMVGALSLAALRGGAPTHHNGRAILVVWLALAVAVGARLAGAPWSPGRSRTLVVAASLASVALGVAILRPWYARLDSMSAREAEARIGAAAARVDGPVLLEVRDFGFFAVQAGSGAPWRLLPDREIDPRAPMAGSSFTEEAALRARIGAVGARHVVGQAAPATAWLGPPVASAGDWSLWAVPAGAR